MHVEVGFIKLPVVHEYCHALQIDSKGGERLLLDSKLCRT